jgi:Flp pilus assembly protein TadG
MVIGLKRRLFLYARSFLKTEDGGVAIYVALVSVVMIGFGALVVDLGRLFTVQTELQHAADAAALAGAAELDGTATAISRARSAATTTLAIANRQTFASGGADITFDPNTNIRFLSTLPTTDDTAITAANVTTDPTSAFYIEVTAAARQVDYLLAPVLAARVGGNGAGPTSGQVSAVAVAGNNTVVCNFPPFMICNPAEANGNSGAPFTAVTGQLIQFKGGGNSSVWGPGNFGLLNCAGGGQSTACIQEGIASTKPNGCYASLVDTKPGNLGNPVSKALNVRFDMYENPGFKNEKNNPDYPPAPNVTKGKYTGGPGGSYIDYPGTPGAGMGLPTHDCVAAGNCDTLGPSYDENFMPPAAANSSAQQAFWSDYWTVNHQGMTYSAEEGTIDSNGDNIVTRQEMYDWEVASANIPLGDIDGDGTPGESGAPANPPGSGGDEGDSTATGENGNPMNYTGSGVLDPDRRVMPVAVVNCVADGPVQGNTSDLPVVAFAKLFLSHAAVPTAGHAIYGEMIGTLQPGVDDELHDIVHLYR